MNQSDPHPAASITHADSGGSALAVAPAPSGNADSADGQGKKKKDKDKSDSSRPDPWQRYRALVDVVKESQDLVDLADHKARFALIMMGALNAAVLILGTRSDLFAGLPREAHSWLYLYFALYATTAVYFFVQAIESLRPRSVSLAQRPGLAPLVPGEAPGERSNRGLRFFADVVRYDLDTYLDAWQDVQIGQLNTELATQAHTLARINREKYAAIARLYSGLQVLTLLTWGLLVGVAVYAWVLHEAPSVPPPSFPLSAVAPVNEP